MQYRERIIGEIELISTHFGPVQFDPDDLTWVLIERFDLPWGFNRRYSTMIIELSYRYPLLPPKDFYLEPGLRKDGKRIEHYYEKGYEAKRFRAEGMAWYCLHIKSWRPDPSSMVGGDNLLNAAETVYNSLKSRG